MASPFLSDDERQALEKVALPPRSIKIGADLVREGDSTDELFFVTSGWVCRHKTTRSGSRQIVALSLPGDAANLDSVMFRRPDYGVRALTAATIVSITRDRMFALEAVHVGIAKSIAWLAVVENAILSQWALCLGRKSARERLGHLLCELNARLTRGVENNGVFDLPLTQDHLADALGLTNVHVNRTMQHLRAEGLVSNVGRAITLPDLARLRSEAEFDPAYLHIGREGSSAGDLRLTAHIR